MAGPCGDGERWAVFGGPGDWGIVSGSEVDLKVGIAGPISLDLLSDLFTETVPEGVYSFPLTAHLVRALLEDEHEIVVFALAEGLETTTTLRGQALTAYVGPYRSSPMERAHDFFRAERMWLQNAMRSKECDVIHAHWTYEFAQAALKAGQPTVVTVHDWAPTILRFYRDRYRAARLLMQARTLVSNASLTAVSPHISKKLRRWTRKDVPVVPNAIPPGIVREESPRRRTARFDVGSLNSGFQRLKNVEAVFQAFQLIRRDLSTARLYLAGRDFGPGEAAERWATARGLTESVTFLGEIPANAIGAFFGKLDLLIHPSLEESFGMSVLEAMASGVPVVGGDRSGAIPWLLGSGRDGALVDIRSPVAIASAALSVLTDEGVWSGYAERAWRRAVEDFDMSTVLERYLREYEAAIRSSARREVNQ